MPGSGQPSRDQPASDIARAQMDKASELGLDMTTWMARRYGHSSGIRTTEPPPVSVDDHTELKPGMVIHLEPGVIGADGGLPARGHDCYRRGRRRLAVAGALGAWHNLICAPALLEGRAT